MQAQKKKKKNVFQEIFFFWNFVFEKTVKVKERKKGWGLEYPVRKGWSTL